MNIVEVDKNYRIVITKEIRNLVPIKPNQKIYLLAAGKEIILMPIPENLNEELDKLSRDVIWNRKIRENLEDFLISNTIRERKE